MRVREKESAAVAISLYGSGYCTVQVDLAVLTWKRTEKKKAVIVTQPPFCTIAQQCSICIGKHEGNNKRH